jgi:uncharacterized protein YcbK (DUF882 family)
MRRKKVFNRFYSIGVGFLIVLVCVLVALTSTKAEAAIKWVDGQPVFYKQKIVKKKVYSKRKRYAKKKVYYKKRRYAKKKVYYKKRRYAKKRIYKSRKSRVVRSGLTKFKGHRMPVSVANKLRVVESKFGKIRITSSCRPGATVRKTGRPSMHRYCRAVDFNPPRGKYRQVARYLKTTWGGGVGTYSGRFNHIHIDDHRGRWHN